MNKWQQMIDELIKNQKNNDVIVTVYFIGNFLSI